MQRKEFLKFSAGMFAGGFSLLNMACRANEKGGKSNANGGSRKLSKIGVQLYTVRDLMQDDFEGTIEKVAKLGYDEVEFAGYYDRTPQQVRSLLDGLGLQAPSTHMGIDLLRNNLDDVIETSVAIGHKYVVCPYLSEEERSGDDYKKHAELFNKVGEVCKAAGLRFAYHNHDFEFAMVGGRPAMDLLMNETDPALVDIELDLFWIKKAGHEPQEYFAKYPGRFKLCHVKDMTPTGDMTSVGSGIMDFAAIFAQDKQAGLEYFIVEHDRPEDPMQSIQASLAYLRKLQFA